MVWDVPSGSVAFSGCGKTTVRLRPLGLSQPASLDGQRRRSVTGTWLALMDARSSSLIPAAARMR